MEVPEGHMEIKDLFDEMREHFEVDGWWPSESVFEVMVNAILTQQTNWDCVEISLDAMRRQGLLAIQSILEVPIGELEEIVRPCGFYRQKAARIVGMARYLKEEYDGNAERALEGELEEVRARLLSLKGVGKETADSILLFAGGRPKFVAAAYASRVLSRTGVLDSSDYDEIQTFVESSFSDDPGELRRLYAMMVELAKAHCKTRPDCASCPLQESCVMGRSQMK
jgi:endonuclease-3 related protein